MIKLYDAQSGAEIGEITPEQWTFLVRELEEESVTDRDYYINVDTLDYLAKEGADPSLIALLRNALGERYEMDIRWSPAIP